MQEQSERDRLKAEEAAKSNSLYNQEEIDFGTIDDRSGAARDLDNESMFNPDDSVVLRNIFDGESTINGFRMPRLVYKFYYNGYRYTTEPGQTVRLPGSQAYLFVKHLVSLVYRRLENKPEMDKRTYPLTDKWVVAVVGNVDHTITPDGLSREEEHALPDYNAADADVANADGGLSLPGRLAGATNQGGGGEFELGAVNADEPDATDADLDKIQDFDPNKNPNVQFDGDGKPINKKEDAATTTTAQTVVKKDEEEFAGANQSTTSKSRQAKK